MSLATLCFWGEKQLPQDNFALIFKTKKKSRKTHLVRLSQRVSESSRFKGKSVSAKVEAYFHYGKAQFQLSSNFCRSDLCYCCLSVEPCRLKCQVSGEAEDWIDIDLLREVLYLWQQCPDNSDIWPNFTQKFFSKLNLMMQPSIAEYFGSHGWISWYRQRPLSIHEF